MTEPHVRKPSVDEATATAGLLNAHELHGQPNVTTKTINDWLADPTIDIRVAADGWRLA